MRIVIHTQYFPPETGAPQNRLFDLAKHFRQMDVDVTILTAMPHYPIMEVTPQYRGKLFVHENIENLEILRSYVFASKSTSFFLRILNYFSFSLSSFLVGLVKLNKFDVIICESPPLILGLSAWLLKVFKGKVFVFNISDLWPESAEKLGLVKNQLIIKTATKLEEFLYRRAILISGQTKGIINNIKNRFPNKKFFWFKNGVNFQELCYQRKSEKLSRKNKNNIFQLVYAGILGYSQGLDVIIKAAKILESENNIKFLLIGYGPEKERLKLMIKELNCRNVELKGHLNKEDTLEIISNSSAAIIPLRNIELFRGAIPSKIFEALALEIPILLGVDGEAKSLFIDEGNCGLYFKPENEKELATAILKLYNEPYLTNKLGVNGQRYVKEYFDRMITAEEFLNELKKLI